MPISSCVSYVHQGHKPPSSVHKKHPAAWGRGKAKGRRLELRPHDRSRCAEHGGVAGTDWHDVRVPPGGSWSHHRRRNATLQGRKAKAAPDRGSKARPTIHTHYKGRDTPKD